MGIHEMDNIDLITHECDGIELSLSPLLTPTYAAQRVEIFNLTSGFTITAQCHLDGGGMQMKDPLIEIINRTGKPKYEKVFEWCAGFGVLGFEVLGHGLADKLMFSDYYPLAIETCLQNAKDNNVEDKVTGYVTPVIKNIPDDEMVDLIVSNPPHCFTEEHLNSMRVDPNYNDPKDFTNVARLLFDIDRNIHREFFKNIRSHLLPDADIYLVESYEDRELPVIAAEYGIELVGGYPVEVDCIPNGYCFHFKMGVQ